jgi:hypothetical protein
MDAWMRLVLQHPVHRHSLVSLPDPPQAAFLRVGLEPEEMSFEQFECIPAPHLPGKLPWAEMAMASGA